VSDHFAKLRLRVTQGRPSPAASLHTASAAFYGTATEILQNRSATGTLHTHRKRTRQDTLPSQVAFLDSHAMLNFANVLYFIGEIMLRLGLASNLCPKENLLLTRVRTKNPPFAHTFR